jgi:hypothetical protein
MGLTFFLLVKGNDMCVLKNKFCSNFRKDYSL